MATSTIRGTVKGSVFKSNICRNDLEIWQRTKYACCSLQRPRSTNLLLLLLPPILHLNSPPRSICHHHLHTHSHLHLLYRVRSPSLLFTMSSLAKSTDPTPAKTVRVVVKGRVQGVFYRNWTVDNATELGLKGWVRNRRDGSVEAVFSGSSDKVEEMEQRCRRGPPAAVVTGLQVFPLDDNPGTGFECRSTV